MSALKTENHSDEFTCILFKAVHILVITFIFYGNHGNQVRLTISDNYYQLSLLWYQFQVWKCHMLGCRAWGPYVTPKGYYLLCELTSGLQQA